MSVTASEPAYCRVTLLAPRTRVDVSLPADLPVAELVPMLLELLSEPEPAPAARPDPWRLFGMAGSALPTARSLSELGVHDGDLLRIAPFRPGPPPPVFDDPADALAATAGSPPHSGHRFRSVMALLLVGAATVVLLGSPLAWSPSGSGSPQATALSWGLVSITAAVAAAAAVGFAGLLARRVRSRSDLATSTASSDADPPLIPPQATDNLDVAETGPRLVVPSPSAATTAALSAVSLAAVAGWAAIPAADPVRVLVAVVAAGAAAALGRLAVRDQVPALVGVLVLALPVGLGAVAVLWLDVVPTSAAVAAGGLALMAGPLLPRAALWLSGLPRPVIPADAAELLDADDGPDGLPPSELAHRALLARGYLAGSVGGCALVSGGAALPAATLPGWLGPGFAALTAVLLGLRARGYADPGPRRALAAGSGAAGVGIALAVTSYPPWGAPVAALGLLLAAALVLGRLDHSGSPGSPVRRRAVDLTEAVLTAAVVPLMLGVLDVYSLVRAI